MKRFLSALLACLLLIGAVGCTNNNNEISGPSSGPSSAPPKEGSNSSAPSGTVSYKPFGEEVIPYEVHDTPAPYIVVIGTNESGNELGKVFLKVTFTKDGEITATQTDLYNRVANGKKIAFAIPKPENYDDYQIEFTTQADPDENTNGVLSSLQFSSSQTESGIAVACQNVSEESVDSMRLQVIYYQKNKVVGCESLWRTEPLAAGETIGLTISLPKDKDGNLIPFNQFELLPVEATNIWKGNAEG